MYIIGQLLFTGKTSNDIYCVACKGDKIASADCVGTIRLWTWTGQMIKVMKEHVGAIRCLQFHPFFDVLISAGDAKFLMIWDNSGMTRHFPKYDSYYDSLLFIMT